MFDALDEETQGFLLRTSVLGQLNGALCDAVTGEEGGSRILAHLYRHNLFTVALDERDEWYRYHHLFRDFLQRMLERSPEQIADLHQRAAAWLGPHGFVDDALDHARLAGDPDLVVALIESALPEMVARSEHAPVERWLRQLPESEVRQRPGLTIPWARM